MNVWARIYSTLNIEDPENYSCAELSISVQAKTEVVLYQTEATARAAQEKRGGIVLEVSASQLRGQIATYLPSKSLESLRNVAGFIFVLDEDREDEVNSRHATSDKASVVVSFNDVLVTKFTEHASWLADLEKELGASLRQ